MERLIVSSYCESDFRKHFETHYAARGMTYEDLAPSYEFGLQMASDPRFEQRRRG